MQLTDQASFEKTSLEHPIPIRVLWAENTPIGLARVRLEGRIGHIDTIGRHPSYKARGAGPLLLQEAIRLLLERGSPEFFRLGVTAENRPAVQLYSRYGFKIRESWTSWLKGV
jgi:ribosomal protein S18 acetylase RimI-like enzyme